MKAKKSEIFTEYNQFLDDKVEELDDFSIHDEGGQALYYLLVKLMGDKRTLGNNSYDALFEFSFPPLVEFSSAAEEGDYQAVISILNDDCELEEHGAKLEINTEIIEKLESFTPSLISFIDRSWDRYGRVDPDFLNSLLTD